MAIAIPTKRFHAHVPGDPATAFRAPIDIETRAVDEDDMRHIVQCMLGRSAAAEATIRELAPREPTR